jgi:hypothetical protein
VGCSLDGTHSHHPSLRRWLQLAAKPSEGRLDYKGEYLPVSDLHCIASGLGSIPAVEIIRELLPGSASSIERANFVWVNEDESQFVLYQDVEKLWYKYSRNLDISCVLEKDCFGAGLLQNSAFLEVRKNVVLRTECIFI